MNITAIKCRCGGTFEYDRDCAADVCPECLNHKGLDRCWCGWARSGGNGITELREMGECLEEEY